jgi:hypothetical protein
MSLDQRLGAGDAASRKVIKTDKVETGLEKIGVIGGHGDRLPGWCL